MARISVRDAKAFFVSRGYSDVAASAIAGGLSVESGSAGRYITTTAVNPRDGRDGSDSVGAAQWNGQRAVNMRNFVSQNEHLGDYAQLAFVDYELRNDARNSGNALRYLESATTSRDATSAFLRYERPGGFTSSNPMGAHSANLRLAATNTAMTSGIGDDPSADGFYVIDPSSGEIIGQAGANNTSFAATDESAEDIDLTKTPTELTEESGEKAGNIKPDEKKKAGSLIEAILNAFNQLSKTVANAAAGSAMSAATATAASNATQVSATQTVMGWFSNRVLQIAVFILAFIFLLIGLYMFANKPAVVTAVTEQ